MYWPSPIRSWESEKGGYGEENPVVAALAAAEQSLGPVAELINAGGKPSNNTDCFNINYYEPEGEFASYSRAYLPEWRVAAPTAAAPGSGIANKSDTLELALETAKTLSSRFLDVCTYWEWWQLNPNAVQILQWHSYQAVIGKALHALINDEYEAYRDAQKSQRSKGEL